ncbi:DNA mismatch repair protein Vsr [Arthrobacter sp. Soil782]|uniref:very short patch repair endonuclease n=1 Tax=Arthrobacter sp. Soil782 TaxID=1736410 RepID=UPI0006FD4C3B|nr:very short patch repair endonuclease [Arthrobacter sp. Soil782]KRF03420.1 DNA mismatch repair protein Vsr [Arthrobacter sp. Soil782]
MTSEQRRRLMSSIRSKDTKPEMLVRQRAHALGYRFRLHGKYGASSLPGKPDLVFAARRKAIFVNGCFWHWHDCPIGSREPKTNAEFWRAKRRATIERDARAIDHLQLEGWSSLTVWECQLVNKRQLDELLIEFLGPRSSAG